MEDPTASNPENHNLLQQNLNLPDRLSGLPDALLHHILSFLPTKYGVGSSVLSKRWKNVWASVPIIDICDELLYSNVIEERKVIDKSSFINFVYKVLFCHEGSNIRKFNLSCTAVHLSCVSAWIHKVTTKHRVEEINLKIYNTNYVGESCVLRGTMFTCESLTMLKIKLECDCILEVTSSICFPKLKVLHLQTVTFCGEDPSQQACLNFPFLEELSIGDCDWANLMTASIFAPKLERLIIYDLLPPVLEHAFDFEIKFYAERLESLRIACHLSYEYTLCHLNSIVDASIDIYDFMRIDWRAFKLLTEISNVKNLTVGGATFVAFAEEDHSAHLIVLPYLINLSVISDDLHLDFRDLMNFLSVMPNLESILFDRGVFAYEEDGLDLATMPKSFLSHLKSIEFGEYHGDDEELNVVGFFLKHAKVLERMIICSSEDLTADLKKQRQVAEEISVLPRCSTYCLIEFS